jgi:hypothetical protein
VGWLEQAARSSTSRTRNRGERTRQDRIRNCGATWVRRNVAA